MSTRLTGISSMATKAVLAELAGAWAAATGHAVAIESVGGVDAAQRVAAGEAVDLVFLASDALDRLAAQGHLMPGSRVDLVRSGVAVAVKAGEPLPDIGSEAAVKAAVLAARSVGYSTGPSGVQLLKQFDRWGITDLIRGRLIQARPGVPVGSMVASGEVALGFQQLSELIAVPGITLVGGLPAEIQIDTVFAGAVATASQQPALARALLQAMADPATAAVKQRCGMAQP